MADSAGQADIRGINIEKAIKGFADEEFVLKKYCEQSPTSAREIRWFQKTAGILSGTTTTGITSNAIYNVAERALPTVVRPSWTRNTSYVKKFFVESGTISVEDIKDTDVDILATSIRDLVRAVASAVDTRIYNVLTESLSPSAILTTASVQDGWDDDATGDPITDLLIAKQKIRAQSYDPEGAILYINPVEYKNLMRYIITIKGSSVPMVSSNMLEKGVAMELLNLKVVVSQNATTDYALVFVPKRACTWKSFANMTHAVIDEPGIGKKIRVWEEGEALLTDPKAVHLTTDTVT